MHYRHNEFQNFLQNLALDAHDALHRKSTLAFIRHCSRVGGGGMINYRSTKGGIYLKRLRITALGEKVGHCQSLPSHFVLLRG